MTTASALILPARDPGVFCEPRNWAVSFWRALLCCGLFSIIFIPEFSRDGSGNTCSPLYAKAVAGFRFVDLAIFILVFCHIVALGCSRNKIVRLPRSLALPGLAFLVCTAIAVVRGSLRGGSNFFFDWRGLALGVGLYFVWSFWMQKPCDRELAVRWFAVYMAVRIALLYVFYAAGYRDTLLGVSIPIFDGPALSCIVFTGLLAFRYQESANHRIAKLLWCGLAAACLCHRAAVLPANLLGRVRSGHSHSAPATKAPSPAQCWSFWAQPSVSRPHVLGSSFSSRIQSLDVTSADTEFSADNADHLLDIADAWDQVRQSPVMGIGLGTSYPTWRIKNWKTESVMVHNAPLHVWLKYGLAGLVCYLWFHVALLRWLYRRSKQDLYTTHS